MNPCGSWSCLCPPPGRDHIGSYTLTILFGEKLVNIRSAFDAVEDNLILWFHLAPYSVVTDPYAIVALISFHLLHVQNSKHTIKPWDFLKNELFSLLSITLRQFGQVLQEGFLIEAAYHARILLEPRNMPWLH